MTARTPAPYSRRTAMSPAWHENALISAALSLLTVVCLQFVPVVPDPWKGPTLVVGLLPVIAGLVILARAVLWLRRTRPSR